MREALFALAAIENEFVPPAERSELPAVVERQMLAAPEHWERYYRGRDPLARRYSYSDRMRYYWTDRQIEAAVETLLKNLDAYEHPRTTAERLPARPVRPGT